MNDWKYMFIHSIGNTDVYFHTYSVYIILFLKSKVV